MRLQASDIAAAISPASASRKDRNVMTTINFSFGADVYHYYEVSEPQCDFPGMGSQIDIHSIYRIALIKKGSIYRKRLRRNRLTLHM